MQEDEKTLTSLVNAFLAYDLPTISNSGNITNTNAPKSSSSDNLERLNWGNFVLQVKKTYVLN